MGSPRLIEELAESIIAACEHHEAKSAKHRAWTMTLEPRPGTVGDEKRASTRKKECRKKASQIAKCKSQSWNQSE